MDKSPDAFRTISEAADTLGVQAHVLRFWESKFSQIKPMKRAGGRRYYRPADVDLLAGIRKLLHEDGMTIKGVQKLLRERGTAYVAAQMHGVVPEQDAPAPATQATETPAADAAQPPEAVQSAPRVPDVSGAQSQATSADQPDIPAPAEAAPEATDDTPTFSRRARINISPETPTAAPATAELDRPQPDLFAQPSEPGQDALPTADTEPQDAAALPDLPYLYPEDPEDQIVVDAGLLAQCLGITEIPADQQAEMTAVLADLRGFAETLSQDAVRP